MILLLLAMLAAYAGIVVLANRLATSRSGVLTMAGAASSHEARDEISLVTWNLGYAALGSDMDFLADGGSRILPRSRARVAENLAGILATLRDTRADVYLFQEVARPSPLNLGVDVLSGLDGRLEGYASSFDPEVATRLLPPPLRTSHGTAIYSRPVATRAEKRLISGDGSRLGGLVKRFYRLHIMRLPIAGTAQEWVIANVHLAAFDDGGGLRQRQLADALRFGLEEYAKGNAVVLGGDWNMEFERDRFAHATSDRFRFWLRDFPVADLPPGWKAVFDGSTPSVRTLHTPYRKDENYVSIVDGFILSPNVVSEEVRGMDLAFRHSDHQPVLARLRFAPRPAPASDESGAASAKEAKPHGL